MLLEKVTKPAPPLPDNISPWLQTVVEKSLTKNPDDRFQSAFEMVLALKNKQPVTVKPFDTSSVPGAAAKAEPAKSASPWDKKIEAKANGNSAPKAPITTETTARPKTPIIVAVIVIAVLLLIGFMMMNRGNGADDTKKATKSSTKTTDKSKGSSSE